MFTRTRRWSLSWASWIQSAPSVSVSLSTATHRLKTIALSSHDPGCVHSNCLYLYSESNVCLLQFSLVWFLLLFPAERPFNRNYVLIGILRTWPYPALAHLQAVLRSTAFYVRFFWLDIYGASKVSYVERERFFKNVRSYRALPEPCVCQ
jgi:uncharacterized membrane protein YcfT